MENTNYYSRFGNYYLPAYLSLLFRKIYNEGIKTTGVEVPWRNGFIIVTKVGNVWCGLICKCLEEW